MAAPIPELSVVRLTHSFEHEARKLPEGSVGTVVHAWSGGEHYAVEFTRPFPSLVSLARPTFSPREPTWAQLPNVGNAVLDDAKITSISAPDGRAKKQALERYHQLECDTLT